MHLCIGREAIFGIKRENDHKPVLLFSLALPMCGNAAPMEYMQHKSKNGRKRSKKKYTPYFQDEKVGRKAMKTLQDIASDYERQAKRIREEHAER